MARYSIGGGSATAGGQGAGVPGVERLWCARHEALHAPFDPSTVVRARDHLLAGVAAFVEGDRTQHIEIEHLRDELP